MIIIISLVMRVIIFKRIFKKNGPDNENKDNEHIAKIMSLTK